MALLPVMSMIACKAGLDAITAKLTTTSHIYIRSGAQEATTLTADAGTLGSTLAMNATAFPASTSVTSNGLATATANAITSDPSAAASITAGHFRVKNNADAAVILQGNVGTSGCDMNLNTTTITITDTVAITAFTITLPCGDGTS